MIIIIKIIRISIAPYPYAHGGHGQWLAFRTSSSIFPVFSFSLFRTNHVIVTYIDLVFNKAEINWNKATNVI